MSMVMVLADGMQSLVKQTAKLLSLFGRFDGMWSTLAALALVGVPTTLLLQTTMCIRRQRSKAAETVEHDANTTDPGILQRYTTLKSYHVESTGYTYPEIRTFYRPHPQADKLPCKPLPLPLIVCIHGLGGSVAQFGPLLASLVCGPCLSIDLPGCGRSSFSPKDWKAYTTESLVQLLLTVIEAHRDVANSQGIIFIGHSMGCSLAGILASHTAADVGQLPDRTVGFVAICPRFTPLTTPEILNARRLLSIPTPIFDLWRAWDRRGGENSASVHRFVGPDADGSTKRMQLRFNEQSKTDVWRRMAYGLLPQLTDSGLEGGLPGANIWAGIDAPVFLIAGEADAITSPKEISKISEVLKAAGARLTKNTAVTSDIPNIAPNLSQSISLPPAERPAVSMMKPARVLKSCILPDPASHALLFARSTSHTISGLIETFLSDYVDKRLSLGWQLQYLSTEGKWEVKNLAKWRAIEPVSEPIAGIFRAMKTMREVDDSHCPPQFVKRWAKEIYAICDISHEAPVYDPTGLEQGGIEYHKFPTVSKLPPSVDEVKGFNDLVDSLRASIDVEDGHGKGKYIGVHCHYGFNRTGFFIVCYLVEQLGWKLDDAIEEFAKKRPPGIKHDYFIDTLFVRYCAGLRRSSVS